MVYCSKYKHWNELFANGQHQEHQQQIQNWIECAVCICPITLEENHFEPASLLKSNLYISGLSMHYYQYLIRFVIFSCLNLRWLFNYYYFFVTINDIIFRSTNINLLINSKTKWVHCERVFAFQWMQMFFYFQKKLQLIMLSLQQTQLLPMICAYVMLPPYSRNHFELKFNFSFRYNESEKEERANIWKTHKIK